MKHYLLNHQPQKGLQAACAQQGQAPTCNARGKGHTSASPKTLTKVILVLLTMFLLPSAAWGQTTYQGGAYDSGSGTWGDWNIGTYQINELTSSGTDPLQFKVPAGEGTSSITLSLAQTKNATEKICKISISTNTSNGVELASAKIVSSDGQIEYKDLIGSISNYGSRWYCYANTPIEWDAGGKIVFTFNFTRGSAEKPYSISSAEVATGTPYDLIVGGITVTNVNQDDVTGKEINGTSEVAFTPGPSPKLALNYAELTEPIILGNSMSSLTIDLNQNSSITTATGPTISSENTANITFTSTSSKGSLSLTRNDGSPGLISSNITATYDNSLAAIIVNPTTASTLADAKEAVIAEPYGLTIAGVAVTSANVGENNIITGNDKIVGTVKFTPAEGDNPAKLQLINAQISYDGDVIVSTLTSPLEINLSGACSIYSGEHLPFKGAGNNASLIFTADLEDDVYPDELTLTNTTGLGASSFYSDFSQVLYPEDKGGLMATEEDNDGMTFVIIRVPESLGLTVAGVEVTSANAENITGDNITLASDGKVSFSPAEGNNPAKLTLKNATLGNDAESVSITSQLEALTINLDGENTLNGHIAFESASGAVQSSGSLTLTGEGEGSLKISCSETAVFGFSDVSYGNGFYLSSATDTNGADINGSLIYYTDDGFVVRTNPENTNISSITFSTTKPGESIWIGSAEVKTDGKFAGIDDVSFDSETDTLTLTEARLNADIISNLPNLIIKLSGKEGTGTDSYGRSDLLDGHRIISTNPSATLKFTTDDNGSLWSSVGNNDLPWEGFAGNPAFEKKLVFMQHGDAEFIKVLSAPTMNYSPTEGKLTVGGLKYENDQFSYYYTITYADGEGNVSKTKKTPEAADQPIESEDIEITNKPFTVEASVEFEDRFGNTTESKSITGKYFGLADESIVFSQDAELSADKIKLIPAVAEGDGVTFNIAGSENTAVIQLSGTKYLVKGLGTTTMSANLFINDAPFEILNEVATGIEAATGNVVATGNVTVVPPAPTIVKDTGKDYLTTDRITITQEKIDGFATTISYTWDEATAESPVWNTYPNDGVPAQTGTLRARVEYTTGKVESAEATENFAVKIDLATAFVSGLENESYTGSAIVPTFTLKESETATTEISNANYDLSYEKKDETSGNFSTIESIIEVGTYKITATGKGDTYGGSRIISDEFKVIQAENAITKEPVSVEYPKYTGELMDLIVAGEATFGDIEYKIGEDGTYSTDIPQASAVGDYTIYYKVEGTENYSGCEEQSLTVSIDKGSFVDDLEITIEGWTYGNEPNEPVLTGKLGEGAVTWKYKYPNSEIFVEEAPTATSPAGNYAVQAIVAETDNYYAGSTEAVFTIKQATIDGITLEQTELTFNGSEQTVTVTKVMAGTIEVAADYYEISGNTGTKAGNYTLIVTAKTVSNGNEFKNNFKGSAEKAWKINHRTIPAEVIAEKFTSEGQTYATFYDASESFLAPQGIVAYIITGVSGSSVTVKAVSYIKAGIPVLLQKTSTSTETEETTDDIFATNILKYAEVDVTANGGQYVLYKNEFVKATGSITSGKCYLDLTGTSFAGTRGFSIAGGAEGTTAISDAVVDSDHSEWFDLQGRKIEKPSKKGLYIRDGKKIVVK